MADNFDLKKFLKESKALENLNPSMKSINEGEAAYEYEKGKEAGEHEKTRAKIREYILAELGGEIAEDAPEKDKYDFLLEDDSAVKKENIKKAWAYYNQNQGRVSAADAAKKFGIEEFDLFKSAYDMSQGLGENEDYELEDRKTKYGINPEMGEEDLEEAKKKKDEEVEDVETIDATIEDLPVEDEVPAKDTPAAGGGLEDIAADMEGTEGELMDSLMKSLKIAKGMNNEKLETQIGNTLKFFVSEYIGGGQE
jgi:hypothetical protein